MTNCRFIHAADLHLDSPFRGIEQVDPEIADALRDASIEALRNIARVAIDRDVDFVLFAGDVYDGAHRGLRAQLAFRRVLAELDTHGIRAFVVHGNHDPLDGWSAIDRFPENTHVFDSNYETIAVERDGVVIATVHGISYAENHVLENLAIQFAPTGEGFEIGLLHTEVGKSDSPYAPCTLDDLARSGLDYWALGHIHDHRVLCEQPKVVYPGNHQGRSFSEEGPKGVAFVDVRDGTVRNFELIETATWRFETLEVDTSAAEDVGQLAELVETVLSSQPPQQHTVLRVRLVGRSQVSGVLAREGTTSLEAELRAALESLRPRVWIARVDDRTAPAIDIPAIVRRDDFTSEVVRVADMLDAMPDPLTAVPAKYRATLRRLLGDASEAKTSISDARDRALEYLLGE